ncbi:hypothetical protein ACWDFR_28695 [Streptomyces sp. 900105755]|uniref:hypothetical protein n=1 Tax=Streptomyces sp. NPDC001507 TaxID=3364579 RepID=UPI0036BB12A3
MTSDGFTTVRACAMPAWICRPQSWMLPRAETWRVYGVRVQDDPGSKGESPLPFLACGW